MARGELDEFDFVTAVTSWLHGEPLPSATKCSFDGVPGSTCSVVSEAPVEDPDVTLAFASIEAFGEGVTLW